MKAKLVILVIDDQPQNIELLETYLVPKGYEIIKASSGEEALAKLFGNQIDLVLLDVMMPKMSGIEVLMRLRADEKRMIFYLHRLNQFIIRRGAGNGHAGLFILLAIFIIEFVAMAMAFGNDCLLAEFFCVYFCQS